MTICRRDKKKKSFLDFENMEDKNTWALSNFDFNFTIRKKVRWVAQLFGDKVIERFLVTNNTEH